jgi:ribosomal protein S18 acetylase RimI-like enzyme
LEHVLHNPVYYALSTRDAHLGSGEGEVKWFHEEVSPFVGFPGDYNDGFKDLYNMLSPGRRILYATPQFIKEPTGWQLVHEIKGLQFVFTATADSLEPSISPVPLGVEHIEEMVALATLTKPGPFATRTIEFGQYHGIFDEEKLVSMTGQRLHPGSYSEISAVCTHPDHIGKGYAAMLIQHQLHLICNSGNVPFLHVREDNGRAIALYDRLGFIKSGHMNFYFMKRK